MDKLGFGNYSNKRYKYSVIQSRSDDFQKNHKKSHRSSFWAGAWNVNLSAKARAKVKEQSGAEAKWKWIILHNCKVWGMGSNGLAQFSSLRAYSL